MSLLYWSYRVTELRVKMARKNMALIETQDELNATPYFGITCTWVEYK